MEDRIEINGKWYVRESVEEDIVDDVPEIGYCYQAHVESETSLFEFFVYFDNNGEDKLCTEDAIVEYTNKFTNKKEYWDNTSWLCRFRDGVAQLYVSGERAVSKSDENMLVQLLKEVTKKKWL